MLHLSSYHSNGLPTVVWSNRVNLIGEKVYKPKIHFCEHCNKPILIYGRLIPCKHVFCFSCATLCLAKSHEAVKAGSCSMNIDESTSDTTSSPNQLTGGTTSSKGCHRCGGKALRVERNTLNSIFICLVESCRRTYLSARDLQAHVTHRHSKNKSSNNKHAGTSSASMAAISSSPYISSSTLLHMHNQNGRDQRRTSLSASSNNNSSSNNNNNNINNNNNNNNDSSNNNTNNNNCNKKFSNNSPDFPPDHHQSNNNHYREQGNRHRQRHHHPPSLQQRDRERERDRFRERDRDTQKKDRLRERENKEYHKQSIQRAAQWAEASAQMMEKGLTR